MLYRYVFVGQTVNQQKQDKLIAIKTFPEETSVTSEKVFSSITELCEPLLNKIYSVMSDTTALNTGKKSGINKCLLDFFHEHCGRPSILYVIAKIEGKKDQTPWKKDL